MTRCRQNLFIRQSSISIKVSIAWQWKKKSRIKSLKHSKALIGCSQTLGDIYENLDDYNPTIKRKVSI